MVLNLLPDFSNLSTIFSYGDLAIGTLQMKKFKANQQNTQNDNIRKKIKQIINDLKGGYYINQLCLLFFILAYCYELGEQVMYFKAALQSSKILSPTLYEEEMNEYSKRKITSTNQSCSLNVTNIALETVIFLKVSMLLSKDSQHRCLAYQSKFSGIALYCQRVEIVLDERRLLVLIVFYNMF
ncbi:hypothetical protein ABPG74_016818 [Tetrahymena malaccensis]